MLINNNLIQVIKLVFKNKNYTKVKWKRNLYKVKKLLLKYSALRNVNNFHFYVLSFVMLCKVAKSYSQHVCESRGWESIPRFTEVSQMQKIVTNEHTS